jgi:hypothetical protein
VKKVILGLGALIMVVSGVAAVSAYEAHTVNVTAKVENATYCGAPVLGIRYGTVFPEEWIVKDFAIGVSTSFCEWPDQHRVFEIDYKVWLAQKPGYKWLGDCLYIGVDVTDPAMRYPRDTGGELDPVGAGTTLPILVVSDGYLRKGVPGVDPGDPDDIIYVGLDVPVFNDAYNPTTDALACPDGKPSHRDTPTVVITPTDYWGRWADYDATGEVNLGADLVIQVTRIYNDIGY